MSKIDQPKPIMHTHKHLRRHIPLRVAALAVLVLMFVMIGAGIVTNREDITNPGASASAAYPADINNDGTVGIADIAYVAGKWGTSDVTADLTKDGTVGILDVSYIATRWGATGTNSISGAPMPTGNISSGGHTWTQIFAEDFTKDAALGTWGNDCDASFIAYTGLTGTKWRAYPKCFLDTYQKRPYRSDAVLSVQNGMLDFWLHTVDGKPAGANPSPVLPNGTVYQTYGRYEARIRQTTMNLSDYHQAWLLWPQTQSDWQCAESDFPEKRMSTTSVSAYHHYGCTGSQDSYSKTLDKTQWHTYTQEWMPGRRNYYVDGVLIGSSTNAVYDKPQRWQLQTETDSTCETTNTCTQDGHLQVDWVVVYAY